LLDKNSFCEKKRSRELKDKLHLACNRMKKEEAEEGRIPILKLRMMTTAIELYEKLTVMMMIIME
jgi:hypothetical protein